MFRVPKDIAPKMVLRSKRLAEVKDLRFLAKDLYQFLQTSILDWSNKKFEKRRKIATFWAQKLQKMTF